MDQLTLRQVRVLCMGDKELENLGFIPQTKSGKKAYQPKIDKAVENLMAGRPWNAK